ncbi:FAD-dependent oxidoreductase [Streptomyces hawaiiensis]|uniref:Pyridine nucleotide-disulfide oxidoreductase n=1 Tax=Streptomyces hawaiiensis TaxID=67305 RepID=A0A6G5RQE3_9ACTN|nr:FAD-dependent oxidoreductase [Streptomyces hawaiiensis]QCD59782.1 pyridine nucleotide-disulfide oxidoreductase [Streptomyces hawaiiensis]
MQRLSVDTDVTVVGGGLAGVAAAIGAARTGARVALINNRPVLGGNASSEVRVWVCGATAHGAQKYARETGVMGELFRENQYRNPEGNPFLWDQVVLDAVRAEPNIRLYLNTDVREVEADGSDDRRTVRAVTGWQMGSERIIRFSARMFVDATGDGLVGALAGAWHRTGREAAHEYGEEWAPDQPDSEMLGSTMFFYTKDTGEPVRFVPPSIAKDVAATSIVRRRPIRANANGCDYWWIEYGGDRDVVADHEEIRDELWAVIYGIWDHIKNSGEFDADTLTLEWVGSVPGKREYRRFVGDHVLTQQDVIEQRRFPDTIGFGGWSIDLHPAGGMYAEEDGSKHLYPAGLYHIPFRSLYSRNTGNLLFAGRDISATHVAFGTTRVMATCAVTGEAAGAAAGLCVRDGLSPRQLATDHIDLLQRTLLRNDASLLGVEWHDPADLAASAHVTASSELRTLSVRPRPGEEPSRHSLDGQDVGLVLPVQPAIESVEVLLEASEATGVRLELWSTGGGENHIPVEKLDEAVARAEAGTHWVRAPFGHKAPDGENVVLLLRRNPAAALLVVDRPGPYGVLALVSRTPRTVTGRPQSNAWSAEELRRRCPAVVVHGDSSALAAVQVTGPLQRPYHGPRMWSSQALAIDPRPWVRLDWDEVQEIGSFDIIFNDDVDIDLINLHHHRTPFPVMPELVRDYRVEALVDGAWQTVVTVEDNRERRRSHVLGERLRATALRLTVLATNGSEWATVVALRVFATEH